MIDLAGRTALVTGGSRGIGRACVDALGAAGAAVVVHYNRDRAAAERAARGLGDGRATVVQGDLSAPGAAAALWAEAFDWNGRIDVLVNNAGIFEPAAPLGDDEVWAATWERTLRVNLTAVGDLCRAAVASFEARAGAEPAGDDGPGAIRAIRGIIVNIASRAGFRGDGPDYWAYGASKGGVLALTRTIARNGAARGILAYAVAPGYTDTDMAASALTTAEKRARAEAEIPMGRLAPPEDVANVVAFLASGLAPHATGTTVDVNGASYVR